MTAILARHALEDRVAFGAGGDRSRADLLADAAAVAAELPSPRKGSHVLLVIERDRYALAAAMLGAWAAGHAVAFPPHGRRAGVGAVLARPEVAALVHDTAAGGHLRIETFLGRGLDPLPGPPAWPPGPALTFYRMGEGASLEVCAWSGAEIEREIAALAEQIPPLAAPRSTSTVEPFGPIGVLLGIMVPLCFGGAFARQLGLVADHSDVIVSIAGSPVSPAGSAVRVVASTTGEAVEGAAHEVLVDRRTRFVATRRGGTREWTMLDGTSKQDALLAPGVALQAGPTSATYLVEPTDARLRMEAWLRSRPDLHDAAVAVALGPTWLAIVAGTADLAALREGMLAQLAEFDGRAALEVRRVVRVPREPEGDVSKLELFAEFGRDASGAPLDAELVFGPPELEQDGGQSLARLQVDVPGAYLWFLGHFATYPIMAGVVQLHELVLPAVRRVWPALGTLESMQRLKFLGRIVPGDRVFVRLRLDPERRTCDFSVDKAEKACAAGRLNFGAPHE